ncbi:hypothetical protein SAMN05192583_1483 [Sphingomonas gellani]|uniref:Hemerythrin HHE cation binding domain-containing protein n=1 Tax=Sphingomonas gellani TaxID=1166340 RepID=A0A1H8C7M7_9SPHN|nr:hypothetical protein [Sphingomonas gellani]SEM90879.1 hypothetical protein SAMN05192583_1483 [Sphingomonas gellani]
MDAHLLDILADHQQRVRAIIAQAAPTLDMREPADPMAISRLRWELVRALNAYQQFKHRSIFDPVIAGRCPRTRAMGEALKADCLAIGADYTQFVQHWTRLGTAGHWSDYREAAFAMRRRIGQHLDREQQKVAALIRSQSAAPAAPTPRPAASPPPADRRTPAG